MGWQHLSCVVYVQLCFSMCWCALVCETGCVCVSVCLYAHMFILPGTCDALRWVQSSASLRAFASEAPLLGCGAAWKDDSLSP